MAEKSVRLTTPKGIAQYPWLNKPDTKFNSNGEYKVNLIVPAKEAAPFIKKVTALRDEAVNLSKKKKKYDLPFEKELDDQGDETGKVILKAKVKNILNKKGELWERKPTMFDAAGNKIDVNVGGGSTIKLNVEVFVWESAQLGVGVTLQPVAVQVLDLVEFGGGNSVEDFGFEKEDGFVSEGGQFDDDVETPSESQDNDLF